MRRLMVGIALWILILPFRETPPEWAQAAGVPEKIEVFQIEPAGELNGEVVLTDSVGKIYRRFIGLGFPMALLGMGETFLVGDRQGMRILEINFEGEVVWSVNGLDPLHTVFALDHTPEGNLLAACGSRGVLEICRSGQVIWQGLSPLEYSDVTGAVRLPNGDTLVTLRRRDHILFRFPGGGSEADEIEMDVPEESWNFPRCASIPESPGEFFLWDNNWRSVYRCTLDENHKLRILSSLSLPRTWYGHPDGLGGFLFTQEELGAGHWQSERTIKRWRMVYQPEAIASTGERDRYLIAYRRTRDAVWPDDRGPIPSGPVIHWKRFWYYLLGGALFSLFLHGLNVLLRGRFRNKNTEENRPVFLTSGDLRNPLEMGWVGRAGLTFAAASTAAFGVYLAARGQLLLRNEYASGWFPFYLSGVLLAAGTAELWRRFVLRERDPYWRAVKETRADLAMWPSLLLAFIAIGAGCVVLYRLRWKGGLYTDEVGLWAALLLITVSTCFLSSRKIREHLKSMNWRELLPPLLLLLVGAVTIGYRLRDVPRNVHFDFVFYALDAQNLLERRVNSIWNYGFVPASVIGTVPQIIGIVLRGFNMTGIRLGGALYGMTGPVAAYILGRAYRDRKTGFIAGLLLAGSIPFIHFVRVPSNGEAPTTALWMITFLALALRTGHPRWWILAGLAGGYTFYLHPVGRPVVPACFAFGVVMFFRSPRAILRRWYGPPLLILGLTVLLVPLLPTWIRNPQTAFPRVEESVSVYRKGEGINWEYLRETLKKPLALSFGWFFVEKDKSSQGTLSPGMNYYEAVLLAIGLLIAVMEGFSLNLLFLGFILLMLLSCGAWAVGPPWYTRLLPSMPIAVVLAARTLTGLIDLFHYFGKHFRRGLFVLAAVGILFVSPIMNLRHYVRFETGELKNYPLAEMTALGQVLREIGPRYQYYMVNTYNPLWTVNFRGGARFGELLPYIWNLRVREVRELQTALPFPENEPAAVIVQGERYILDVPLLQEWYPETRVLEVTNDRGGRIAAVVLINE